MNAIHRLARSITLANVALSLAIATAGCTATSPPKAAARPAEPVAAAALDPLANQRAFFENLRALCGQTFGGRTILAPVRDKTFEPARLYMVVKDCKDDEIRIPFVVDGDASRTWVFQMRKDGLRFFHEHLRPDGTAHEPSGFGGNATMDGTPVFQSFPDFESTADTPVAKLRVWRLRLDTEHKLFVYYLDWAGLPLYRLAFHMGPASPPLPR
ncbi:MAG: hypothetical protein M3R16_10965 [Pseudomonadota bacterium]|nr:hypothetical protein [Pseudomonadota bacterium]